MITEHMMLFWKGEHILYPEDTFATRDCILDSHLFFLLVAFIMTMLLQRCPALVFARQPWLRLHCSGPVSSFLVLGSMKKNEKCLLKDVHLFFFLILVLSAA